MNKKNEFTEKSYNKLKSAINNIDSHILDDIYALSLWFSIDEDDPRYPVISVSYNTISNYRENIQRASDEMEAKWNFAFWLQDEIEELGGQNDEDLKKWFETSNYFYSDDEKEMAEEDKELYDKISDMEDDFCDAFIDEIILNVQQLFANKIIENKFGKSIPVLVHELEYYDKPVGWTIKSNPKGLVDEFVNWTKFE